MVASHQKCGGESDRIDRGMEGQAHLLVCGQRDGIAAIRGVEGGHDPQHPLVLLFLDLLIGFLALAFFRAGLLRGGLRAGAALSIRALYRRGVRGRLLSALALPARGFLPKGLDRGNRELRLGSFRKLRGGANDQAGAWFLRKKMRGQRQKGNAGKKCRRDKTRT